MEKLADEIEQPDRFGGKMTGPVNVGRPSLYGNPVRIGDSCPLCHTVHKEPGTAVRCFRTYLFMRLTETHSFEAQEIARKTGLGGYEMPANVFADRLLELDGKLLFCPGCGIGHPECHARVLESAVLWLKTRKESP